MLDTKALAAAMAPVLREAVEKAVAAAEAPLMKRIEALEMREPQKGERGQDGVNGQDGRDGKDADPVSDAQIAAAVEAYIAANPPAAGRDGADGKDGTDGKDADMDLLKVHAETLIEALPKPENGKDGRDGKDGEAGAPGKTGLDGKDGADGVALAGALIDRSGNLILTLSDGTTRELGAVIGKDGRDGRDGDRGPAGFSLADFDTEFRHADKTLVLKFAAGDTLETHEIFLPYVRDVGVWKDGATYLEGDGVTWGGSFWTAQKDTTAKPDSSDDWRLAVKRGRDGKDFAGPQVKAPAKVRV